MSSYNYIGSGDFGSLVASDFNISGYINMGNDAIESLALANGVSNFDQIDRTPLDPLIKQYGVRYTYCQLYLDKLGANNTDTPDQDKYLVLYNINNDLLEKIRRDINQEHFLGYVDSAASTATTVTLFRG